ncbi:hypothetical protein [Aliivibrio fischeri]|uniref:Uncharacterized protein n=1 Tax=Aliivibrio fischeri TaxID=668 RepID=A0A510UNH4_ALIFS|nr:hypothetical protein [Aliivibrio fischeri]MUK51586.1 hypothetical protein [Aliivibrio fischeri]GEK16184.1 hypothetical protein AFI02nite_42200 [Aliivibrio fischeri]
METLITLRIKARTYAQHGGAWNYLVKHLKLHGVSSIVAEWYVECARKRLSELNAYRADREFNRIENALAIGSFGTDNDLEVEAMLCLNRFEHDDSYDPDL